MSQPRYPAHDRMSFRPKRAPFTYRTDTEPSPPRKVGVVRRAPVSRRRTWYRRSCSLLSGWVLVWCFGLFGCAHDFGLMKLEEQVGGYGAAIRWNMFQTALSYHELLPNPPPDYRYLQNIKVTGYKTLFREMKDDDQVMEQTVEIRYVNLNDQIERTLTHQQHWRRDARGDRWRLWSDFPTFH